MNGHVGRRLGRRNGLLQGLPSSCPLWNIYVEPFVRHLRDTLRGVPIPGPLGRGETSHTVDAFADDIKAYCADMAEVEHLAQDIVPLWERASNQIVSVEKFTVILCGTTMQEARPALPIREWQRYGIDDTDKSLGIRVGTPAQVAAQWQQKVTEVEQLATDVTAGRRLAGSVYARSAVAKGGFASKVIYSFAIQAPAAAQVRGGTRPNLRTRGALLQSLQKTINQLVFGKYFPITINTAQQPKIDGGIGHINVERRLNAEWAHFASQLANDEHAAWKNIWWWHLRNTYGAMLCTKDLLLTSCTYALLRKSAAPSEVQKLAMQHWGCLERTPATLIFPTDGPRRRSAIALAA